MGQDKNSEDPADFNGYLRAYPSGEFAGLARIRLRVLDARGSTTAVSGMEQKPSSAPSLRDSAAVAITVTPATAEPSPPARRGPTMEETLTYTAPGQDADVVRVTYEVVIEYEPLSFDDCRIQWRDQKDTLSVTLSDLDPLSVKVEPRSRPNTTFSTPIWDVTVKTLNGAQAVRVVKDNGSGVVSNHGDLDLQFGDREKAERLARLLQQAVILCNSGP